MRWLRSVGSLKSYVSFAKEPYKRDCILQKRPRIVRSLLLVATPYESYRLRMTYVTHSCAFPRFTTFHKCEYDANRYVSEVILGNASRVTHTSTTWHTRKKYYIVREFIGSVNISAVIHRQSESCCIHSQCGNVTRDSLGKVTRGGGLGSSTIFKNLMSPTPRRKWYLTTGRRAH